LIVIYYLRIIVVFYS